MNKNIEVRSEWGEDGILQLKSWADVIIIVDVLSFSTCVDIVVSRGSVVYPYRFKDESLQEFAQQKNATAAVARGKPGFTLSPASLLSFPENAALVLPSPNGATLSLLATQECIVLSGCLRNASSVAKAAMQCGGKIAVVPAGERWSNNRLRVSYEDLVGAGSIINAISGKKSSEAMVAMNVFNNAMQDKFKELYQCFSALELIERGYPEDVSIALQYDVSTSMPVLHGEFYAPLTMP